ncbi:MAG: leucine-rich repeat protein [Alistipes sp.]|nr:leucine-rich repeat protein [Alistipes sp.]
MKRFTNILLLALATLALVACDNEQESNAMGITFDPQCDLSPTFGHKGGSKEYTFTTTHSWSARADHEWVTITPSSGDRYNKYFVIAAMENTEGEERTTNVTITLNNGNSVIIPVVQEMAPRFDTTANRTLTIGSEGGNIDVEVATNQSYNIIISKNDTWLTAEQTRGAMRDETIRFTALQNDSNSSRIAVVNITSENNVVLDSFNIIQYSNSVAKNELVYYTPYATRVTIPEDAKFGAQMVAHLYDPEHQCNRIIFDNAVLNIPANLFAYRDDIRKFDIPECVEQIEDGAFSGCAGCNEFIIPTNIKSLGGSLFEGCSGTLTVNGKTPDTKHAASDAEHWLYGSNFETVVLNSNIGDGAFRGYEAVTTVNFDDAITSIGVDAFAACPNITEARAKSLVAWCGIGFGNSAANPLFNGTCALNIDGRIITELSTTADITSIRQNTFSGYKALKKVVINDYTTALGAGAFYMCDLEKFDLSGSVVSMGIQVFAEQNGEEISYTTVGALSKCKIATLTINGDIKAQSTTGDSQKHWLTGLEAKKVIFSDKCSAVNRLLFSCSSVEEVSIASSVKTIDEGAFASCHKLTTIELNGGLETIGVHAFYDCPELRNITMPDSVVSIGDYAFDGCAKIESLTLPASLTSIGQYAFYDCDALTTLYSKATTPPVLSSKYVFNSTSDKLTIYVPESAVKTYKADSNWNYYASYIQGYTF